MKNISIAQKLVIAFSLLIFISVLLNGVVFYNKRTLEQTSEWSNHTYQVLQEADNVMAAMVDQETGFRGYLITGNADSLGPYKAGKENFRRAITKIKQLTSDNPAQQRRLDDIAAAAEQWQTDVAAKGIQLMAAEGTRAAARDLEVTGAGKTSMDGIRVKIGEVTEGERALLVARDAARVEALSSITLAVFASALIMMVVAFGCTWFLTRGISTPIKEITATMGRIAAGELQTVVHHRDRKDEVGSIATALQSFRDGLAQAEAARREQVARE